MTYREHLRPPVLWWVVAIVLAATFVVAVGAFLGRTATIGAAVAMAGVVVAVMASASSRTTVDRDGIRVGAARLEWAYAGTVTPCTREQTRELMGVRADPRAYLAYRTYADESVQIEVTDPADPHPYWLVSSRSAAALADQIADARTGATA